MSTSQLNLQAEPSSSAVTTKLAVGIGMLVAVAVAVLLLVGTGNRSYPVPTPVSVSYPPTPLYHGTGAPPVLHRLAVRPASTAAPRGDSIPGDTRTEHSYGAVP